MRNTRLTSVLTLLCVPLLLAAAALVPLALMAQTDQARLETAHSLPAPADIGAPDAQAMEIPLVAQLYQLLLTQDADAYSPYVADENDPALACTAQDALAAFEILRPALPADWAGLADAMTAQADRTQVTGAELNGGFSTMDLQFIRDADRWHETQTFGTLTVVTAPDGVTPVQMNLYLDFDALPLPAECTQPEDPEDPYAVLESAAQVLGLGDLDWQPTALNTSDGYWCISSDQANLRLVLHAQYRSLVRSYWLDVTLTMVPDGKEGIS